MKSTTVTLYDDRGEDLPPQIFPSAREAREAESACRARLLAVLGWNGKDCTLPELAWFVRDHAARIFYETHSYPHGTDSEPDNEEDTK